MGTGQKLSLHNSLIYNNLFSGTNMGWYSHPQTDRMPPFYPSMKTFALALIIVLAGTKSYGQSRTPLGDTSVYGTGDVWKAYVFQGMKALLPATLTDWTARLINANEVSLTWKIEEAINFDHFIVQRSYDAQNFSDIKLITAKTGTTSQLYSYIDRKINAGKVHYKLAMVDKDGSVRYSSIEVVSMQQTNAVRIYPTVVENKQVFVESNKMMDRVLIEVVDMNGRILQSSQQSLIAGRQAINLHAGKSMGSYIVRVSHDGAILVKQAVIVL